MNCAVLQLKTNYRIHYVIIYALFVLDHVGGIQLDSN
jgi:hypothetical protein